MDPGLLYSPQKWDGMLGGKTIQIFLFQSIIPILTSIQQWYSNNNVEYRNTNIHVNWTWITEHCFKFIKTYLRYETFTQTLNAVHLITVQYDLSKHYVYWPWTCINYSHTGTCNIIHTHNNHAKLLHSVHQLTVFLLAYRILKHPVILLRRQQQQQQHILAKQHSTNAVHKQDITCGNSFAVGTEA